MATVEMMNEVKGWIEESILLIKDRLSRPMDVSYKSGPSDLVTNIDKEVEAFFVSKIKDAYPNHQVMGEEGASERPTSLSGAVWFVDPIDGTLNCVKEQEDFCVMVGYYEEGIGQLGFIVDVMKDEWCYGGKDLGVFLNHQPLTPKKILPLSDGLVSINNYLYGENILHAREIGDASIGVRHLGCAGIEIMKVIKGNHVAYISKLAPWDIAAGAVMLSELGMKASQLDGTPIDFFNTNFILAANEIVYEEIQKLVHS